MANCNESNMVGAVSNVIVALPAALIQFGVSRTITKDEYKRVPSESYMIFCANCLTFVTQPLALGNQHENHLMTFNFDSCSVSAYGSL